MISIILLVCLLISMTSNSIFLVKFQHYRLNPVVKTEYKEIEVIKKAMCECGHVSSMHKNSGSCQALTFYTDDGKVKLARSIECPCHKYTGPLPMSEYFDDQLRELESHRDG